MLSVKNMKKKKSINASSHVHMYTPARKSRAGYLLSESHKAAEGHRAVASLEAELPCLRLQSGGVPAQCAGAGEQ